MSEVCDIMSIYDKGIYNKNMQFCESVSDI